MDKSLDFAFHSLSFQLRDAIVMNDTTGGENGISFCSLLRAATEDGTVAVVGEHLIVENATTATLYFTAATTYRHEEPEAFCRRTLDAAVAFSPDRLYERHLTDYQALFRRVRLELDTSAEPPSAAELSTDERLQKMKNGHEDVGLMALYYQFGRYLLISCSRPGTLPANLQGIWNQDFLPSWDSKYTININTEMNYWPAESCNLSECHEPLFDHLERIAGARKGNGAQDV